MTATSTPTLDMLPNMRDTAARIAKVSVGPLFAELTPGGLRYSVFAIVPARVLNLIEALQAGLRELGYIEARISRSSSDLADHSQNVCRVVGKRQRHRDLAVRLFAELPAVLARHRH
jgi:hypothetical protein